MNIRLTGRLNYEDRVYMIGFLFCAAFFFLGTLIGVVSASNIPAEQSALIKGFFYSVQSGVFDSGGLLDSLAKAFLFHTIAVLLGFSAIGFIFLPLLSLVRGFFLTFAAAAIIAALGKSGFAVAIALLGLPSLIMLPCFFILCLQAFAASYSLAGRLLRRSTASSNYRKEYFNRCAVCSVALIIAALIDAYLSPLLASLAAGNF